MSHLTTLRLTPATFALFLTALLPAALSAQTVPPAPAVTEPAIELSPFEVRSEKDVGYVAENTLSGSRLNASLKDTPAMVTVFTEDMIRDLGVNDLNELVRYDANTQPEAFDSQGAANSNTFSRNDPGARYSYRSRGLPGSFSRDFFLWYSAQDNYNISRVDFSKGPNGVLFGVGAIGGTLNSSINRAQVTRNFAELELQAGSWDLMRETLDYNRVLVRDKLAFRIDLLDHNENGYRYHTFNDKQRGTLSVTLRPWQSTVLKASYEAGSEQRSNQRPFGPADEVSEWLAAGKPLANYTGGRAVAQDTNGVGTHNNTAYLVSVSGLGAYNEARGATTTAFNDFNLPGYRINYAGRRLYENPGQFGEISIPNRVGAGGPDTWGRNRFNSQVITLEQTLTRDLHAEFSFFNETLRTFGYNPGAVSLNADPNPTLPSLDPTNTDTPYTTPFRTNPNAGRYYLESSWNKQDDQRHQLAARATLAYDFDPARRFNGAWSKFLGTQRFALGWERNRQELQRRNLTEALPFSFIGQGWNGTASTNATNPAGIQRFQPGNPENAANSVWRRHYVTLGDWKNFYTGQVINEPTISLAQGGGTITPVWVSGGINARTDDIIDGNVVQGAMQNHFLKDRLVTTVGYRRDLVRIGHGVAVRDAPQFTGGPADFDRNGEQYEWIIMKDRPREMTWVKAISRSVGAVAHLTKSVGVFANYSSGTGLPEVNQRIAPRGDVAPGMSGETTDYGILFNLFDDRVSGRIARYDTKERNRFYFQNAGSPAMANDVLAVLQSVRDGAGQPLVSPAEIDAHTNTWNGTLGDGSSKGYEVQLRANPTRNITLAVAYSYTDRKLTNAMRDLLPWVNDQAAFYAAKLATVGATPTSTRTANGQSLLLANRNPAVTVQQAVDLVNSNIQTFQAQRSFGFGEAPHKVVSTGKYSFLEGALRGFSLGGSVQWQSAITTDRVLNYNDANGNFAINPGELILDANGKPSVVREFKGNEFFNVDAFASYRINQVFGHKVDLTLQLNVRNLLDETDIIKQSMNASDTGYGQYVYRDPRSYRLTLRWKF
jgi:iron complex outermembrane recepter protein